MLDYLRGFQSWISRYMWKYNGSKTCNFGVFWPLYSYQTTPTACEVRVISYEGTRLPIC